MDGLIEPHDPLPDCDCKECALVERNRLRAERDEARARVAELEAPHLRHAPCGPLGYATWEEYRKDNPSPLRDRIDAALKDSPTPTKTGDRCPGVDMKCGEPCSYVVGHVGECMSLTGFDIIPFKDAP